MRSDEALAAQVAQLKDAEAFELLMERHQSHILALLTRLTRNRATAEDLTQDTFVGAWRKMASFKATGSFRAWLSKLAYRQFLMHARKRVEHTGVDTPEPAAEVDLSQQSDLDTLLAMVSEEESVLLTLSYALELSHSEIADVVGEPTGTIKSKIHRAKEKIRSQLALTGAA